MALPIAHAAAGYLVARAARRPPGSGRSSIGAWRRAAVFMIIGNLPDLDFLIGFAIGRPGLVHRGFSHTLLAAVLFGIATGAFASWRGRERFTPAALALGAAYASHILLDWLSNDTRPPLGVMALWPFSYDYYKASIEIFPPVSRRYWESRFWIYNLRAVVVEVIVLAPITALSIRLARGTRKRT